MLDGTEDIVNPWTLPREPKSEGFWRKSSAVVFKNRRWAKSFIVASCISLATMRLRMRIALARSLALKDSGIMPSANFEYSR